MKHPSIFLIGATGILLAACTSAGTGSQNTSAVSSVMMNDSSAMMQASSAMMPSSAPSQAAAQTVSVTANDNSGNPTSIYVKKGTMLTITFNVAPNNVYHGGLDFRSPALSTGTIPPGTSKSITFTVTQDVTFQPYWPASNIKKPYAITVHAG